MQTRSCAAVNAVEQVWTTAAPQACPATGQPPRLPGLVQNYLCGVAMRLESTLVTGCENIAEADTASLAFTPDSDTADIEEYTSYTGNGRRILTVPIADSLADTAAMTVLGFRQFLLEPTPNQTNIDVGDSSGRFLAVYLGNVAPLRQGSISGCSIASGPGKVVLHQ